MKIVVTGGSGNVGRYVVPELLEHHEVKILDRKAPEMENVAFVRGDVLDVDDCRRAWFPEHAESYRTLTKDPGQRKWMNGLWLYNDSRDVARAFRLAAEAEGIESEAFLISAEDNGTAFDTMELVRRYYPGDIALRKPIEGRKSLADWSKAKRMLGFEPRYTWRDPATESKGDPSR